MKCICINNSTRKTSWFGFIRGDNYQLGDEIEITHFNLVRLKYEKSIEYTVYLRDIPVTFEKKEFEEAFQLIGDYRNNIINEVLT